MNDKVIITCAVTGSSPVPDHPGFPRTNEEVANAALDAGKAGASIVHVHVRKPDGAPSTDLEDYEEVCNRIRQKNNELVINLTTGPGCNWIQSDEDPAISGRRTTSSSSISPRDRAAIGSKATKILPCRALAR